MSVLHACSLHVQSCLLPTGVCSVLGLLSGAGAALNFAFRVCAASAHAHTYTGPSRPVLTPRHGGAAGKQAAAGVQDAGEHGDCRAAAAEADFAASFGTAH